eukprot:14364809-Ditylum_brightwellii.AAC.1
MPKGWRPSPVQGLQQPHVIPQMDNPSSFNMSSCGYANAAKALAQCELRANVIVDEEMSHTLEY